MRGSRSAPVFTAVLLCLAFASPARAQIGGFRGGAVGGISIDASGIVTSLAPGASEELAAERRKLLSDTPITGREKSSLRKVSLARLCERLKKLAEEERADVKGELVDLLHLGGLERITHVLVDPEGHDIVLAGPADRAVVDGVGNVVAAVSGRPLLRLEDFVIAMAAIQQARQGGIRCSIDPTPEGITRLQQFLGSQRTMGPDPDRVLRSMEESLGLQNVTVGGVPDDSRFAQVLVAADYKLKRIGMGLEPSGVREVPSYLSMVPAGGTGAAIPRFWLEPSYDPIRRDADELAWSLSSRGMKCLSEADMFNGQAMERGRGQVDPAGRKWCEAFTANYDKLAAKHPVFRELDNCVDVAVVAALIQGRQLEDRAGVDLSIMKDPAKLGFATYAVPTKVSTVATGVKKGSRWVLSASGGVLFQPWEMVAGSTETADAAKPRADALAARPAAGWWWD